MTKTRVPKGEKYWCIDRGLDVGANDDVNNHFDEIMFRVGNYFHTKEEADAMAAKLRAVLKGAEILEDWQKEKIASWDTMLETKDEISKNYSKLLNNPKVQAVLKGADVIEIPSEEEITDEAAIRYPSTWNGKSNSEGGYEIPQGFSAFIKGVEWLKSKIVK